MNKISKLVMFVVVALVVYSAATHLPSRGATLDDTDLNCQSGYRVCFTPTSLVDKAFTPPISLADMTTTTRQDRPTAGQMPGQYVNMLHYPGSLYRIQDRTDQNGGLALGFMDNILDDTQGVQLLSIQGCGKTNGVPQKYEWRPDHVSYACSNGFQYEVMPINNQTILGNMSLQCTSPGCTVSANANAASIAGTYNGYSGWQITTGTHTVYVLFNPSPTTLTNTGATFADGYKGYVAVVMAPGLADVPNVFNNPHTYVMQAVTDYQTWYRARVAPSLETTSWGKERYYRSLNTYHYTLFQTYTPATTKLWGGSTAVSPGGFYMGVWIWDSFFAAWANVQTCADTACVNLAMDALRILKANQYGDGQYPRQVEHYSRSGTGTWQAPGGWSFAVDQADTKYGTHYGAEFYDSLKAFHNYVRTQDSDGDGVYEWDKTNSGWDNSPRWITGKQNAVDLQSWMILDAESLRNIAHHIGNTADETLWENRRQAYITALQPLCSPGPYCYDTTVGTHTKSTVLTPATYYPLLAGALTTAQAQAMLPALHDTTLLGPDSNNIGILPSVSRSDPNYDADGNVRTWGGPYWTNLAFITYMGLKRYGLNDEAEYVRSHTQHLTQLGGVDMESYVSDPAGIGGVGARPQGGFNNYYYGWTAAGVMLLSTPTTFTYNGILPPCTSSWTCPSTYGACSQMTNGTWYQTRICTDSNNCIPGNNLPQTTTPCTAPSCVSSWTCPTTFGTCTQQPNGTWYQTRTCTDGNSCTPPNSLPQTTQSCTEPPPTCVPTTETCNGLDDDCDGQIDESLSTLTGCTQVGLCSGSHKTCAFGTWSPCSLVPLTESCNNVDDNCDGTTDTMSRTCFHPTTGQSGTQSCTAGIWSACQYATITTYTCVNNVSCVPDYLGTYTNNATCTAACFTPQTPTNTSICGLCSTLSNTTCGTCTPPPPDNGGGGSPYVPTHYACRQNGTCEQDTNGVYLSNTCNSACPAPKTEPVTPPTSKTTTAVTYILITIIAGYLLYKVSKKK